MDTFTALDELLMVQIRSLKDNNYQGPASSGG